MRRRATRSSRTSRTTARRSSSRPDQAGPEGRHVEGKPETCRPSEACVPRARLALGLAITLLTGLAVTLAPQAHATRTIQYVHMDDGVQIAVSVHYPKGYHPGQHLPSVLEMSGYDGAAAQNETVVGQYEDKLGLPHDGQVSDLSSMLDSHYFVDDGYIVVEASVRGTGCSGGTFDLFSWRTALDGRNVIEWMARQPWSNAQVGLLGHSYSGITGFMIAATRPPHLTAASVSGLV